MGVFDRQTATALRMIAARGESVTWQSRTAAGGTAAAPAATVITTHTVRICFLPLEREYLKTFLSMLKDTDIPSGLMMGLMGRVNFAPALKDTILRTSGEVLAITDDNGIEMYDPNGEGAILYVLRLSR